MEFYLGFLPARGREHVRDFGLNLNSAKPGLPARELGPLHKAQLQNINSKHYTWIEDDGQSFVQARACGNATMLSRRVCCMHTCPSRSIACSHPPHRALSPRRHRFLICSLFHTTQGSEARTVSRPEGKCQGSPLHETVKKQFLNATGAAQRWY